MARPQFKANRAQKRGAYKAAKRGLNDEEISKAIKVPYGTFKKHKDQFIEELKKGRAEGIPVIIDDLQNALLKKACGFEYTEIQVKKDGNGNVTEKRTTKKYYPPDSVLLIFSLCNLDAIRYRSVNRVTPPRESQHEPTADELYREMGETTPTPYAIPVINNTDQIQNSAIGTQERKN